MALGEDKRVVWTLCGSHFLSTWGDRMWSYAVAIFLVEIGCGSLRLPAIYGLTLAAVNIMGGTFIGRWVDTTGRLRVARLSLFVQNFLVIVCAVSLVLLLHYKKDLHGALYYVLLAAVISVGAGANLTGRATTIAIERDWVVVIFGNDKDILASVNAKLRRIDLFNKIVAPLPVSFIMDFQSQNGLRDGAIFIAAWNFISAFLEYFLLLWVYRKVPALSVKQRKDQSQPATSKRSNISSQSGYKQVENDGVGEDRDNLLVDDGDDDEVANGQTLNGADEEQTGKKVVKTTTNNPSVAPSSSSSGMQGSLSSLCMRAADLFLRPYVSLYRGWSVYREQTTLRAGIALSLLYMTVLGFNGITNGFLYSQGLKVWQVSVCQALGAIFGIVGTFVYPPVRRCIGAKRAGLIAIWAEATCASLAAVSVFLPGNSATVTVQSGICTKKNTSDLTSPSESTLTTVSDFYVAETALDSNFSSESYFNVTETPTSAATQEVFTTSLVFFLTGIITARVGLWMFDLAVTQLYQEVVPEQHRGTVGGVQGALNSNMDLLHFVLVIAVPDPKNFGGLVLASVAFVTSGAIVYLSFERGWTCSCFRRARPMRYGFGHLVVDDDDEDAIGDSEAVTNTSAL